MGGRDRATDCASVLNSNDRPARRSYCLPRRPRVINRTNMETDADCITMMRSHTARGMVDSQQWCIPMTPKAKRLTVSLDEGDYSALSAIARRNDASLSWVIRQAIHRFVQDDARQPASPRALQRKPHRTSPGESHS